MKQRRVLVIYPTIRGGIRREIDYIRQAWRTADEVPPHLLIDARGQGSAFLSPLYLIGGLFTALKEILLGRVAVMYINMSIGASTFRKGCFMALAALTRTPAILHLHSGRYGYYFEELPGPAKAVVRAIFRNAVKVVVLGEIWKTFVVEQIGIDPAKIVVMPNAVPAPTNGVRRDKETCKLLFLGWLSPDKGIPELLNALADPRIVALDWHCVLAGADPRVADGRISEYRQRVKELDLRGRVEIPGWVDYDQVHKLLAESNVTVLPSHFEGLPMTVLEGMAYHHAIVTTPVGVLPEIIEHEKSGILNPVGDESALADSLYRIIGDADFRIRLGDAAHETFLERLEITPYTKKLHALFRECGLK